MNYFNDIVNVMIGLMQFGLNPLSIIFVFLITSWLKANNKFFIGTESKPVQLPKTKVLLTALIFGISFAVLFCWLFREHKLFTIEKIILNSLLNITVSAYSDGIWKGLLEVKKHFIRE